MCHKFIYHAQLQQLFCQVHWHHFQRGLVFKEGVSQFERTFSLSLRAFFHFPKLEYVVRLRIIPKIKAMTLSVPSVLVCGL